ncbi:MAG TPA: ankyrin repeat domain-containing protein [Gaiellaceae bacterium]
MAKTPQHVAAEDSALLELFRVIASGDEVEAARRLSSSSELATRPIGVGANREDPDTCFLVAIRHYVYVGDTALHIAAAAHRRGLVALLVARGADVGARNRRGAEPLHYAADGSPGADCWHPASQGEVVGYLVEAGGDPNVLDKSGVAPLHRAVRSRSSAAVRALLEHGADPRLMNKSGSTPLHLAVQNTGRSGSGSDVAKGEQRRIIALLLAHGANPTDADARGKTVEAATASSWVRDLLHGPG